MKCDGCQIECDRAEVFQRHTRFFGADRSLCPACFQNKDHKAHIFWIWVYLIFGVLALPAIFYSPTRILGILMLNVFVFQLFLFISTVLHELGHAIAGRSCGMRVFGIEIGKGRIVYEFHVKHLRWCVRDIPFGGVTYGVSHSARLFQIKQFFYILGGPLVNGIIFFVALKLRPLDGLPTGTSFEGFLPVLLLKWSNALLLIYSLVPHFSNSVAGKIPNDGLWLFWKIWGIKKEQVEENLAARYLYEAGECRLQKNLVGAQKWLTKASNISPIISDSKCLSLGCYI